jgi:hypothetical protein
MYTVKFITETGGMMKRSSTIFTGCGGVILALAVVLCGLLETAYCQTDGTMLLLQQTPPQGGMITPGVGVHNFGLNTEVTLTAIPKPGYQFVYWMGDVSDPTANRTIVHLDAPKIVIAVFERSEYEFLAVQERAQSAPRGGLVTSAADYSRGGISPVAAKRPHKWRWPSPPEPPEPEDLPVPEEGEDFPVPEEGEDFPVPIPEPATVCLVGLGGLALLSRKPGRHILEGKQK